MRVISNKALTDFANAHKDAQVSLQAWRKMVESNAFTGFNDLRAKFGSVDKVGDFHVFDIRGNNYRIIAAIHFDKQRLYIRHVFTHAEYDKWKA